MKALTLPRPETIVYEEVCDPELVYPTDAIIRVRATAICGSDLHLYHGRTGTLSVPMPIGHEYVGVVEATGTSVRKFQVGARVTGSFFSSCGNCWACARGLFTQCEALQLFGFGPRLGNLAGTQAERVRIPYADVTLIAVPDDVSDEAGLTVGDIASTAYFAVDRACIRPGDVVAVVGLGPVGLLAVELAYIFGAAQVLALDLVPDRLTQARQRGAVPIVANENAEHIVRDVTRGRGADAVIEAVGSADSLALAIRVARGFATISSAGVFTEGKIPVAMARAFAKDLTLRAGMCNVPAVASAVMSLVQKGRLHPERLFTHHLTLSDGERAYQLFSERKALKVLLRTASS
ncbi:MAG: alcohol dehydrogenase [Sulfobacillus acidophilus]|uniref:Alcohol dehydrogenase n=1 Tax=Sulfobacillus acidophilus TaxID=53633 RepID=A0A2T2WK76_9FIRM|nr:MAG: alcohol dehydrogenase [Sulfobacillus acidophilus]